MGGAVSTGQNNNDLIDNLLEADYIRTPSVENVFRAVDRADYFLPASRTNAYKDLAWKSGNLHLSAPCIYSEVMEGLCLQSGLSFLNLGSGTGYLSTMVGLIIGSNGINHGVEIHEDVIQYANKKLEDFKKYSGAVDQFDFCEPKFLKGNCLCLNGDTPQYDRVYCGAACPPAQENYIKHLLKIGGILVMPQNDQLVQIKRTSEKNWDVRSLLPVSFATLILPQKGEDELVSMIPIEPLALQGLCRVAIRNILRKNLEEEYPNLTSAPTTKKVPKKKRALRRLVVPFFDSSEDSSDNDEQNPRYRDLGRAYVANEDTEPQTRDVNTLIDIVLGRLRDRRNDSTSGSQGEGNEDRKTSESNFEETIEDDDMLTSNEEEPEKSEEKNAESNEEAKNNVPSENGESSGQCKGAKNGCDMLNCDFQGSSTNVDGKKLKKPEVQSQEVTAIIEHPRAERVAADSTSNWDVINEDSIGEVLADVLHEISKERGGDVDEIEEGIEVDAEPQEPEPMHNEVRAADSSSKSKREKFDSGLGDEMIEKDSSVDLSSDDLDHAMDIDSCSSSDGNQEEKRHKRYSGPQRVVTCGKMRRVALPNPIFDSSDSEGENAEENIETNEVRTVSSPYTALMKSKINDLPLPTVLKNYLNFYREF